MNRFYSGKTTPNGGKVEWISQYDTIQVDRAGDSACKRACEAIMSQLGIKVENPDSNNKLPSCHRKRYGI